MKDLPSYVAEAVAKSTGDAPAFTHQTTEIPMSGLDELPLGLSGPGGARLVDFQLRRANVGAMRAMRDAVRTYKPAKKYPGARVAAEASSMVETLCGGPLGDKVSARVTRFGGLTVGDAWTVVFLLQAERSGGLYKLGETGCPQCGHEFKPVLNLTDRPVRAYREQTGEDEDGNPIWGGPLPADQTPHAVIELRHPLTWPGQTEQSTHIVMRSPQWFSSVQEAPSAEWESDEARPVLERVACASVVGDQRGLFGVPMTPRSFYNSDLMAIDLDRMILAGIELGGGPPGLIRVACPSPGPCEAVLGFPVGWDNADFFDLT